MISPNEEQPKGKFINPNVEKKVNPLGFKRNLAIVVGIDEYSNGIKPLKTAVNDARQLAQILKDDHQFEVKLLVENVTLDVLKNLLNSTPPNEVSDSRFLFYFAGHGIAMDGDDGPVGYLIPQDARPEDRSTLLPMVELHQALNRLPCRHLLAILDCCFAGAFRWSSTRDLRPVPEIIHRERYERFIRDSAWQAITSAAYDQQALDILAGLLGERGETQDHSPFALALFDALKGAADVVPRGQGDGVITATELYLFLRDYVEIRAEERGHFQTPGLWPLNKHDKGEYIFLVPDYGPLNLPPAPELNEENNPYRGLQSYDEIHAELFFGRTKHIQELAERVEEQTLTIVLGASGTGKSSLVKAGLLPLLRDKKAKYKDQEPLVQSTQELNLLHSKQELPISDWHILPPIRLTDSPTSMLTNLIITNLREPDVSIHPGEDPIKSTVDTIRSWLKANPNKRLLLVIDQFEELVTVCHDEVEREQFLTLLTQLLNYFSGWLRTILTLRSDFEPQFSNKDLFKNFVQSNNRYIVPPLNQDELREVIEGPASMRVLYFEPSSLVDDLINEVVQTPGGLPLLSFTLSEMYIKYIKSGSDDRALTKQYYDELHGVIGSLQNRATQEYDTLDPAHQSTLQRVMLRMISTEGGELASRRVLLRELDYSDAEENKRVQQIIDQFVSARLLVRGNTDEGSEGKGDSYVEPAHDALVRGWDRLLVWKQEAEEYLSLQRSLTRAANEWVQADAHAKTGLLWNNNPRLPQLSAVLDPNTAQRGQTFNFLRNVKRTLWPSMPSSSSHLTWLNQFETDFVRKSIIRRSELLKRILGIALATIILLIGLIGFAVNEQNQAIVERSVREATHRLSRAEQLAISTNDVIAHRNDPSGSLALILARESVLATKTDGYTTLESGTALRSAIDAASPWKMTLPQHQHTAPILSITYSPDGKTFATGSGTRVTSNSASIDPLADDTLRVWDAGTGQQIRLFSGHLGQVNAVTYSPDGQRIATASADDTACVWEVQTGKRIRCFKGNSDGIQEVKFRSDGRELVTAGANGMVSLWDMDTGELIRQFIGHTAQVNSIAINPDDTKLVTGSNDHTACLWDMNTGQKLSCYIGHSGEVLAVDFGFDGKTIITGGADKTVRIWDLATGQLIRALEGHRDAVTAIASSPDGKTIVTASRDGTARLWNASSRELLQTLKAGQGLIDGVTSVSFNPDGQTLLTATDGREIRHWNVSTGEEIPLMEGHTAGINDLAFSPDGAMIASASDDGTAGLWNLGSGREIRRFIGHEAPVNVVAFNSDGSQLLTASDDGTARLWDVDTGAEILRLENRADGPTEHIKAAAFMPDGKSIVTASNRAVRIWNIATGKEISHFEDNRLGAAALYQPITVRPDGQIIGHFYGISSDSNGVLQYQAWLWDVASGKTLMRVQDQTDQILSAAISPSGDAVITGDQKGIARIWEVASGREIGKVESSYGGIQAVAFSPDGRTFATGAYISQVWDYQTRTEIHEMAGAIDVPRAITYSPDGKTIATAGNDRTIRIWSVVSIPDRQIFKHTSGVQSAVFSPDGTKILTAAGPPFLSKNDIAYLWDRANGTQLQRFVGHTANVSTANFSPNGNTIVTASLDGTARLWDVATGQEIRRFDHPGHAQVASAVFSHDGKYILTATGDRFDNNGGAGVAYLWDAQSGQILQKFEGHEQPLTMAVFSPDDKFILTGSWDNTARLWDVKTGKQIHVITGHLAGDQAVVQAVAFGPTGDKFATAGGWEDSTVRIWDTATGSEISRINSLEAPSWIYSLTFSNDGKYLLITHNWKGTADVSGESAVRVWNLETGEEVRRLVGHTGNIYSAIFSPDGKTILTASDDGTARLWPDVDTLMDTAFNLIQREPPLLTPEELRHYGFEN